MGKLTISKALMSMFDNNALLGVRVRVWIRELENKEARTVLLVHERIVWAHDWY